MSSQFIDDSVQQEYTEATTFLLHEYECGPSTGTSTKSMKGAGHASLCAPLHLALLISPLYLLVPFRIVKYSFHRRPLIEYAHKLGPHKPRIILEVENHIWDAVFAIAENPQAIETIIHQLASRMPWNKFDAVSTQDGAWFELSSGTLSCTYKTHIVY